MSKSEIKLLMYFWLSSVLLVAIFFMLIDSAVASEVDLEVTFYEQR